MAQSLRALAASPRIAQDFQKKRKKRVGKEFDTIIAPKISLSALNNRILWLGLDLRGGARTLNLEMHFCRASMLDKSLTR